MNRGIRGLLWIVVAIAARGDAFPPPATPLVGIERFLSPGPRLPWQPVSTLHEAWHVTLPEVARTVAAGWRFGHWEGTPQLKSFDWPGLLPWLAIRGGVAVVYDGAVHAFDARTGGPPRPLDGKDPLILLCQKDGSAETIDLVTRRTLWTQPKEPFPLAYRTDFVSTLRGLGTAPDIDWAGRAPIRITGVPIGIAAGLQRLLKPLRSRILNRFLQLLRELEGGLTLRVTATAYDPLTGRKLWERFLGNHGIVWTWGIHSYRAMVDERNLYVISYQGYGDQLEAYDLADGHLLWSTPQVLHAWAETQPPGAVEGRHTLSFPYWSSEHHQGWQSVDLHDGTVRTLSEAPPLAQADDEPADNQPWVKVLDPVTHALLKTLHTDQPGQGDSVHVASGTLDDGQPVVITYAAGVLRGWLRGP